MTNGNQRQEACPPLTLWLIDDEREIYAALLHGLRNEPRIRKLRWFSSCPIALKEEDPGSEPDVVLLDLNLPGIHGLDAIPLLRARCPGARIIILTVEQTTAKMLNAAAAGIAGYLLKPFRVADVVSACDRSMAGGVTIDPHMVPGLLERLDLRDAGVRGSSLTPTEHRTVQGAVRGMTNAGIAADLGISVETVKTHLKHIYRKLDIHSRPQLVAKVLRERIV